MSALTMGEWACPYCGRMQMVTDDNYQRYYAHLWIGETKLGSIGVLTTAIRCLKCNEPSINCDLFGSALNSTGNRVPQGEPIEEWRLRPSSSSKPQPSYIPDPLTQDYYEACKIRDLSPKASATLARRCLQGMIRDFCGIRKSRLIDEIKELEKQVEEGSAPKGVEPETVDAIDAIRKLGNIGAHMEKDINLIVDVDPGEAQALIELIEMLFDEWYVARQVRGERLAKVQAIAGEKAKLIADQTGNNG